MGPNPSSTVPAQMDPNRMAMIREAAANGDPQAQAMLQQIQGGGQTPPQGQPPGMSQSQFSGYGNGAPVPADVQAQKAKQLIQILRARGGQ